MSITYQYRYIKSLLKRYGFRGLVLKTLERRQSPMRSYGENYRKFLPTEQELQEQREHPLAYEPLVSVVVPAYETPENYLRELIGTLLAQTYQNWELVLADGSAGNCVEQTAKQYAGEDGRIRYCRLAENKGISGNTNAGFAEAEGEYIALMDHDDLLTENALYEMVRCLNLAYRKEERKRAMIYSDEDKINGDGSVYSRPHFKPDYNPEFLRRNNYFCHFLMLSADLVRETGGLDSAYDGAQDYDFVLRCVEAGALVRHVPKILYHWRIHEGSTAGNSADKAYAFDNGCRAIEAHLERIGEPGQVTVTPNLGVYRIAYAAQGTFRVSVVSEDPKTLSVIRSYYETHTSADCSVKLTYVQADFFDQGAAELCTGDYILAVGRGVQVEPEGLLENLLSICQHPGIGIVGAKVLMKHRGWNRVASCGMTYSSQGDLTGLCSGLFAEYKGYFLHGVIPKNVSIVPFDCVLLKKEAWERAGDCGREFSGVYRAADYCFRLQELGYQIVVTPEVTVQKKAGEKTDPSEEKRQRKRFCKIWKEKLLQYDPCYHPNLSQQADHTYACRK